MDEIITERSGSVLRVELNRPTKKNAMTSGMYVTLADLFKDAAKDERIRVVLWHGAGDSFCAGNDVEDFLKNPPGPGGSPQARLMHALLDFDKPLIAAVHGAAIGSGTTMLTHCDFIPKGESPTNRSDIEVLFDQLPEPIDLELDLANRVLYWTDRGDPPRGNTVNRAPIDTKAVPEILITHLMEGIGIALDVPGNRMFVTDFAGSVYSADLDGKNERNFLYAQGNLTGIAYAEV
jgi:hypothetical protein